MNDLNSCSFIGRLGNDPDTRYTPSGDAVTNISIACGWKGKDKEGTEWIKITAFGKLAEIMAQYLSKGSQVFVEGRMKTDKWQDKDGRDRYTTSIIANKLQMLGGKGDAKEVKPQQAADYEKPEPAQVDGFDEIPF
jgi:single-strand DNA-binding protein